MRQGKHKGGQRQQQRYQQQRQQQRQQQQQPPPPPRWVDLNSATTVEIAKLQGVNLITAEAIVARRPLRGWDDLRGLTGVSEGLIKQLRSSGARIAPMVRPVSEA
jgi:DNA uptake protein ComE-like DNA-binding protein